MADVTLNIRHNADQAASSVKSLSNAMGSFAYNSKKASTNGTAAASGFKKIGQACLSAGRSATKGASGLSKFVSSIGRIAFYRAIRSAIRYVTDAFREGLDAAYNWSKEQGGANAKLAAAMDNLSAASGRMKLQLGAAFGGLIVAIEPILIRIINLVTQAAEAITRFFAVLNGTGYYKKASEGFDEVGNSAGGAGKKIKGLLASWDELNVIGKESGGGGGGSSATDYSGAYEWAEAESEWAQLFLDGDFFGIGEKINSALGNVSQSVSDWANGLKDLHIGTKVAQFLNGIFSDREAFENAGKAVGDVLTTLTQAVSDFIRDFKWEDAVEAMRSFMDGFIKAIEGEEGTNRWETLEKVRVFFGSFLEVFKASTWKSTFLDVKIAFMDGFVGIQESIVGFLQFVADHPVLSLSILGIPASVVKEELGTLNAGLEDSKEALRQAKIEQAELALATGKSLTVAQEMLLGIRDETGALTEYGKELKAVKDKTEELDGTTADITVTVNSEPVGSNESNNVWQNITSGIKGVYDEIDNFKYQLGLSKYRIPVTVEPELGDTTEFKSTMDKSVTKTTNPWHAWVDPVYHSAASLAGDMTKYVTKTNSPWHAWVDPVYHSAASLSGDMTKNVTKPNNPWPAWVDAVYHSSSSLDVNMAKNVTRASKPWQAAVDPKLNNTKQYIDDMAKNVTNTRTVSVNAVLNKSDLAKQFKDALNGIKININSTVDGVRKNIGKINTVAEYAEGGWPVIGDLFLANEAGPELVGTMNGNTAVANNDQIVAGIQSGVAQANAEQNELLRQQNSILTKLLEKNLTITPSVALGQVVARSTALYGRA